MDSQGIKVNKMVILGMLKFLRKEVESETLSADAVESVEVAIQCLESAYGIEGGAESDERVPDLADLVCTSELWEQPTGDSILTEASEEAKSEAEILKYEGNKLMKEEKYDEATKKYTK